MYNILNEKAPNKCGMIIPFSQGTVLWHQGLIVESMKIVNYINLPKHTFDNKNKQISTCAVWIGRKKKLGHHGHMMQKSSTEYR